MPKLPSESADRFVLERIFHAPRDMVWRAWTDPKYVSLWWGPKGFTAPVCRIDFRVGGRFLLCMRSPSGLEYWNTGEYVEIREREKIILTMCFADANGNSVAPSYYGFPESFPETMLDIVIFESVQAGKTKVTLRRDHAESLASQFGEIEGWNQSLDKFASALNVLLENV